jgi:hypothetical protein
MPGGAARMIRRGQRQPCAEPGRITLSAGDMACASYGLRPFARTAPGRWPGSCRTVPCCTSEPGRKTMPSWSPDAQRSRGVPAAQVGGDTAGTGGCALSGSQGTPMVVSG